MSSSRIAARFASLAAEGRAAFIPFIMAGDPGFDASLAILKGLPDAGADLIELGVCFTDPTADGPAIQAAGLRALSAGQTLRKTLEMVKSFRMQDEVTPIILMGYYNPFYAYGAAAFLKDATEAGVDGLIVVDLPPEEDEEFRLPARDAGLDVIRLVTPTTDEARLPAVIGGASGFLYYVSVAGVTGGKSADPASVAAAAARIRAASGLPAAVGFGVKTPDQAAAMARAADGVVVGSALVERVAATLEKPALDQEGVEMNNAVNAVLSLSRELSGAVRAARGAKS